MLARKNRFHGHGSVRRVYRMGRSTRSGLFSLHSYTGEKVRTSKVAIVVSRKVHKSAVKRNKIRRRLFATIRPKLEELKQPTEIVVTVYLPEIIDLSPTELTKTVDELFKRAKI